MAKEYGKNGCDNGLSERGGLPAATEKAREAILKGQDGTAKSGAVRKAAGTGGKMVGPHLGKYEY